VEAYVYLQVAPGKVGSVLTQLAGRSGVRSAIAVVGFCDVLLQVDGTDVDHIASGVLSQVHTIEGVTRTVTAPVVPADRVGLPGWGPVQSPPLVSGACYVHVKAQAGAAAGLVERISEMNDVAGVAVLGGGWDLLICVAQPWEIASGVVLDEIHALPGVVSTSTLVAIAYEEPDEDRDQFSAWS
jgi:DNA-binding Lrp family transcriptional regulator